MNGKTPYSDEDKNAWIERYRQLNSYHKVAAEFGVATMTVRNAVIQAGAERGTSPRYTVDEKKIWISLFNAGESVGEIARRRNVSDGAVRASLRKAGLQTKSIRRHTRAEKDRWIQRYLECANVNQVATEFGAPASTVLLHLSQEGLDTSRKKKYSEEEISQWIKAYQRLGGTHKVAREFGLHQGTVYSHLRDRGVIEIPPTVAEEWGDEINRLHQEEYCTIDEIAERLEIPAPTVYAHIREFGEKRDVSTTHRLRLSDEHHFFDDVDSEDKAYWLGFILADGNVSPTGIRISLARQDRTHLSRLADIFDRRVTDYNRRTAKGNISEMSIVEFGSKHMSEVLVAMGVGYDKAHDPDLAKVFQSISPDLLSHFVRGVFDGDGHLSVFYDRQYRRVTLGFSGNRIFTQHLRDQIVAATSVSCKSVFDVKASKFSGLVHWNRATDICSILHWMYDDATVVLPRKYEKAKEVMAEFCNHQIKPQNRRKD